MGIRIDALDAAVSAIDGHQLPAMAGGATVKLTVAQISEKVRTDAAATFAPLVSPAFTGNPTVPTPSTDDDDTSIANTGWVQGKIADAIAINPLTGKPTPDDADVLRIGDSAASFAAKKLTFASLRAWILSFVGKGLLQEASSYSGVVATGTNIIPDDDTTPQIAEGTEFMSLVFTPTRPDSILDIDVQFISSVNASSARVVALFRNGVSDALKAARPTTAGSGIIDAANIRHAMVAGGTSPITFSVRAGPASAATITMNGAGGARRLGGVMNSYITIRERTP